MLEQNKQDIEDIEDGTTVVKRLNKMKMVEIFKNTYQTYHKLVETLKMLFIKIIVFNTQNELRSSGY